MGLKVAVASGNWSNPATWNASLLPKVGDVVASNNFTVTIDQNVNVDLLTNTVQATISSVPIMTGFTTPSGIVTSSGDYDLGEMVGCLLIKLPCLNGLLMNFQLLS